MNDNILYTDHECILVITCN